MANTREPHPTTDAARNDGTREKLLLASLDLFGQYGFEGVSTRKLAERAGVNLQAINYYFVSKRGLYNAVADYLIERLQIHVGERRKWCSSGLLKRNLAAGRSVSPKRAPF